MSTIQKATDLTLVNRAGVDYHITLDKMSTLQDTDLLLVNRAGVDYQCTAKDIKGALGGGSGMPPELGFDALSSCFQVAQYSAQTESMVVYAVDGSKNVLSSGAYFFAGGTSSLTALGSALADGKYGRVPFTGYLCRTPYGYRGMSSYGSKGYDNATHKDVVLPAITAQQEESIAFGSGEFCSNEAIHYQNGWYIFGPTGYLHYPVTTGTPAAIEAAAVWGTYPASLGVSKSAPLAGNKATPLTATRALGYHSKEGLKIWDNATNKVHVFHPHTGATNNLTTYACKPIGGNNAVWIGEYLFYVDSAGSVFRNVALNDYSSFVKCTFPAGYAAMASDVTSQHKQYATYRGRSGDYYMLALSASGYPVRRAYIMVSKDEGMTWEEKSQWVYNNQNSTPGRGPQATNYTSAVDNYTGMLSTASGAEPTAAITSVVIVNEYLP